MALAYLLAALVMVARTRALLHRPVLVVSVRPRPVDYRRRPVPSALILMHDVRMGWR
jgi:hypothetical protein